MAFWVSPRIYIYLLLQSGSGRQYITGPGRLCTCAGRQFAGFGGYLHKRRRKWAYSGFVCWNHY